jgi:hypothetical protein
MKHLKMLGLAAIAALGLMAFVGAGTASATKLCTDSGCTTVYPANTTIHAVLKSTAKLTSGGSTIAECEESTVHGTATENNVTWVVIHFTVLTWNRCNQTTDTIVQGTIELMTTTEGKAEVRGKNSEVTVQIFGVSCTYGTGEGTNLGTVSSGSAPVLKISTTVTKTAGGFLCPATAGWDAEYELTEPHAVFIQ